MSFDVCAVRNRKQPVRHEPAPVRRFLQGCFEQGVPHILGAATKNLRPVRGRDILSHGVPFVAVDAAFALLEVDRVGRQVPVHHRVAVGMEIQSLLPDGSGRQHKGPERGVEGLANLPLACAGPTVVALLSTEAHGEVVAHAVALDVHGAIGALELVHARGACAKRKRGRHRLGQPVPRTFVIGREQPFKIAQRVDVLVQHCLQVARRAIVHDLSPVWRLVISGPLAADERRCFREIEQLAEAPSDPGGGVPSRECRTRVGTRGSCECPEGARRGASNGSSG